MASERAARVTLDLTRRQSQVGYVNFLTLLQAEQAFQTATINLVQAQANRFSDTAALFQALDGGLVAPDRATDSLPLVEGTRPKVRRVFDGTSTPRPG